MDLGSIYTPSRWGEVFHALPHDEALGAGSAGPGKSLCLLMDPLAQILVEHQRCTDPTHPYKIKPGESTGWALHLRRTMPMLELSTVPRSQKLFKKIDPGAEYNSTKHYWTFSSGYRYQFAHCKDPGDWEIYQSGEFTHISFDELNQFEEEQYLQICTRLRSSDPVLRTMLKVRAMSNPVMLRDLMESIRVNDPFWVRKRFVDPAPQGKVTLETELVSPKTKRVIKKTRIYWPATLYDNPDPEFVEWYEGNLLEKPLHIRKALLDGDWYFTAGSYFTDWDRSIHTCEPFRVPEDWLWFRSMDWGFKVPGCVHWWAIDPQGTMWCVKELTFQGKTATEVAKEIQSIETDMKLFRGGKSLITGPADNQIWAKTGSSAKPIISEFTALGINWVQADKLSRRNNAMRLAARLKDHNRKTTTPGVVFFHTCREAITTVPGVVSVMGDPETPAEFTDDHWFDSVLYAAAFASKGRVGTRPKDRWERIRENAEPRVIAGEGNVPFWNI